MSLFSVLKESSSHLYRKTGKFNLYFHFYREAHNIDTQRLKHELKDIKQMISSIENMLEKL